MFSIWTKGIADFLNLTPGGGTARLMSLRVTCQLGAPLEKASF